MANTETVNAAAPKTLQEQIDAAQARLNKLLRKQQVENILNSVGAGDVAAFRFGRGDKARDLTGVVAAVGDETNALGRKTRMARITVGEGLEAESFKVRVADILQINGEAAPVAEADDEEEGDEAPEGDASDAAGEDPLAAE